MVTVGAKWLLAPGSETWPDWRNPAPVIGASQMVLTREIAWPSPGYRRSEPPTAGYPGGMVCPVRSVIHIPETPEGPFGIDASGVDP